MFSLDQGEEPKSPNDLPRSKRAIRSVSQRKDDAALSALKLNMHPRMKKLETKQSKVRPVLN